MVDLLIIPTPKEVECPRCDRIVPALNVFFALPPGKLIHTLVTGCDTCTDAIAESGVTDLETMVRVVHKEKE